MLKNKLTGASIGSFYVLQDGSYLCDGVVTKAEDLVFQFEATVSATMLPALRELQDMVTFESLFNKPFEELSPALAGALCMEDNSVLKFAKNKITSDAACQAPLSPLSKKLLKQIVQTCYLEVYTSKKQDSDSQLREIFINLFNNCNL